MNHGLPAPVPVVGRIVHFVQTTVNDDGSLQHAVRAAMILETGDRLAAHLRVFAPEGDRTVWAEFSETPASGRWSWPVPS